MKAIVIVLSLITFPLFGQVVTDTIQTSAECGQCKERIEGKLNFTKGVKFAELDFVSKELVIRYKPGVISKKEIYSILNELGYDADDKKADPEIVKTLPVCCQPDGMKSGGH